MIAVCSEGIDSHRQPETFAQSTMIDKRIVVRSSLFPAAQAILTGCSTLSGILMVLMWRPDRPRLTPFYSDATHNDPERVILALGENMACFFMPLVAVVEYMHHLRLCAAAPSRLSLPRWLRYFPGKLMPTTDTVVKVNFAVTLLTTVFFFITANVPSRRPFTFPHQMAASGLILAYSIQSSLKAMLAETFNNYQTDEDFFDSANTSASVPLYASDLDSVKARAPTQKRCSRLMRTWHMHHMKLRMLLAGTLWFSLVSTWFFYAARVLAKNRLSNATEIRRNLATCMAVVVYAATISCVVLMAVMAIDMRSDRVVIFSAHSHSQLTSSAATKSVDNVETGSCR